MRACFLRWFPSASTHFEEALRLLLRLPLLRLLRLLRLLLLPLMRMLMPPPLLLLPLLLLRML